MDKEIFFKFKIRYIQIDLNQIFKMKPSEFKISISVDSYDEKLLKITEIATFSKNA